MPDRHAIDSGQPSSGRRYGSRTTGSHSRKFCATRGGSASPGKSSPRATSSRTGDRWKPMRINTVCHASDDATAYEQQKRRAVKIVVDKLTGNPADTMTKILRNMAGMKSPEIHDHEKTPRT